MKDASVTNSAEKSQKPAGKSASKGSTDKRKRNSGKSVKTETNPSNSPQTNGHNSDEKENSAGREKMNAFQFMMNSRQKSIGRNSPGRDPASNDSPEDSSKRVLKARKNKLQVWADQKGAAKRKREYDEIGECISHKLEKRGKKLRKMLNIDCQSDDEAIRKRKKKRAVIESDGDSQDEFVEENVEESEEKVKKKRKNRSSPNVATTKPQLTPKSVNSWRFKIKLCMDENTEANLDGAPENEKESNGVNLKSDMSVESPHGENFQNGNSASQNELQDENTAQNQVDSEIDTENTSKSELDGNIAKNEEGAVEIETENASQSENIAQDEKTAVEIETENPSQSELQHENDAQNEDATVEIETEGTSPVQTAEILEVLEKETNADDSVVILEQPETETKRVLRTRRSKPKFYDDFLSDSGDEDSSKSRKNRKKDLKVAPVFLKAMPKPKPDPKLTEAKRQFLLSGVPSSLKKEMERQQCVDDVEFDVFPSVSHVQQKSPDNLFWDLPKTDLKLSDPEVDEIEIVPPFFSRDLLRLEDVTEVSTEDKILPNKIKNCKGIIKEIKCQNPNYPVYKIFNSIYAKSWYKVDENPEKKIAPKRRGRPKKTPDKKPEPEVAKFDVKQDEVVHSLWTEKYKPKSSEDILGNHSSISKLKEWLTYWLNSVKRLKNKKSQSDSDTEFDVTDSDSRDSTKIFRNTVILKGPCGSGKTAAVYALCNELGFDVLEVNASSKRTGKRLLQELQEATQSHQVCKTENALSSFVIEKKEKTTKSTTKMCVLLIEDVDLVFDQDEGFTAALSQIITTSKRPIILTTTDAPSCNIQRVLYNYRTIHFGPLTSILTIWLQIVCLVEGLYVQVKALDELLNYNRGDIRRTLLQLQLYVNSGGQPYKNDTLNETEVVIENDLKTDDDNSNQSDLRLDETCENREQVEIHHNCLVRNYNTLSWLHCNNPELTWWNFPSILNMPNLAKVRLERSKTDQLQRENETDKQKLKMISDCYDSLSYADFTCGKSQFGDTLTTRWRTKSKDGLGLQENISCYSDDEFCEALTSTLLNGTINAYKERYGVSQSSFKMAVPESTERRWRSKNLSCEEKLQQALLQSDSLARKSLVLDYMPYLRTMARFDLERASTNAKRGNRFYSHLKSLGVRCGETTYQLASAVFQIWD